MNFSIIIPIYKEKKNLTKLLLSLTKALKSQKKMIKYEIIFVDDDSQDGSIDVFKKNKNKKIRFFIRKEKPRDLSKSVVYGFTKSKYDNLIVMDGDFQHQPSDLKKMMLNFQKNSCDILVGSRNMISNDKVNLGILRFYVSRSLNSITNYLFNLNLKDPMSGFFIIKKEVFKKSKKKLFLLGYKILLDIILSSSRKIRIEEMFINFKSREKGFSKMRLKIITQLVYFLLYKFIFR